MIPGILGIVVVGLIALATTGISRSDAEEAGTVKTQSLQDSSQAQTDTTLIGEGSEPITIAPARETRAFEHCGMIRHTCVVDGDTFWLDGAKIRIADIDTPEVSQPQCSSEKQLGDRATDRLIELLNAGPFELRAIGDRDTDRYGRKLRVVVRDGQSLGDQLVREGLARTWSGRREPWC